MLKITKAAAEQIRKAAQRSGAQGMALRILASIGEDGTITYGMAFDEAGDDDTLISSEGIDVVVKNTYKDVFIGMTVDYVELNPGEHRFIIINPNDPHHTPPSESTEH